MSETLAQLLIIFCHDPKFLQQPKILESDVPILMKRPAKLTFTSLGPGQKPPEFPQFGDIESDSSMGDAGAKVGFNRKSPANNQFIVQKYCFYVRLPSWISSEVVYALFGCASRRNGTVKAAA